MQHTATDTIDPPSYPPRPQEHRLSGQPSCAAGWLRFQRWWSIAVLSLIVSTWPLWFSQGTFPAVPMVDLSGMSTAADRIAVGLTIVSLLAIAVSRRPRRWLFGLLLAGWVLACVVNQHRLQPWVYQASLHCIAFACLTPRGGRNWLAAVTISIYFYSACGKFDFQFLHTVGQQFVAFFFGPANGPPDRWRLVMAAALPVTELAVALALCTAATRRYAGIAAMAMHAGLIAVLGPWSWGHSTGVLLWNVWLIALAWYLFVAPPYEANDPNASELQERPGWQAAIAHLLLAAALLLPLFERVGYWDHWLSWSLYSPHTSRVEVELHRSVLDSLPQDAERFVAADNDQDQWHGFALDRWSLEALKVPLYPQARFQLGVARSLATRLSNADGIRVKLKSASNRWDGSRRERWLQGRDQLDAVAREYWLLSQK